jgi:hypothetical protein
MMRGLASILCGLAVVAMMEVRSSAAFVFSITLGDTHLSNASEYDLNVEGKKKFSLRVKMVFLDAEDFENVYQAGQKFDSAIVEILSPSFTPVATYTLGDLIVETVHYSSDASTNQVTQEVVLSGKSLVVTNP